MKRNSKHADEDQKRMFLVIGVCAAIMLAWGWLNPPPPPVKASVPQSAAPASVVSAATSSAGLAEPISSKIEARKVGQLISPTRDEVTFTNVDGQLATWDLLEDQYKVGRGADAKPYPLVYSLSKGETGNGLFLPPQLELSLNGKVTHGEYAPQRAEPGTTVLSWTDSANQVKVTRSYTLDPETYAIDVVLKLENTSSTAVPYGLRTVFRGAQNDEKAGGSMFSPPVYAFEGVCEHSGDDFERADVSTIKSDLEDPDDPTSWSTDVRWGGVSNRYFMTALVTAEGDIERCSFDLGTKAAGIPAATVPEGFSLVTTVLTLKAGEIAAGSSVERKMRFYAGPKKFSDLSRQDPKLSQSIDFGWFTAICIPMLWLLKTFFGFIGNWGFSIILLTVFVKLLTFPLTHKQYKSMAATKKLQPKMKALQAKYKEDKPKLQQEMMKLYKEHKVNPIAGCLPMVLMMPIYFSLYRTIYSAVELYHAEWIFWIHDLSSADPYYVMPVLLGILFFLQTRFNPTVSDNPQQQLMMKVMPVMFSAMMLFLPAGLVLYITVNTGLGLVQQYILLNKNEDAPKGARRAT